MSTIAGKRPCASGRWTSPTRSTPSPATMSTSDSVVGVAAWAVAASAVAASRAPARVARRVFTRGTFQPTNVSFVHVYDAARSFPACGGEVSPSTAARCRAALGSFGGQGLFQRRWSSPGRFAVPTGGLMSETQITVVGNVAWTPNHKALASGTVVTDFRLAHTPSRFDKATGEWKDLETMWYSVTCWRGLADNVAASVHKGDRVVVQGRLSQRSYEKDGQQRVSLEIDASSIGFDLSRFPVMAMRPARPVEAVEAADAAADEAAIDQWASQAADPLTGAVL